GRCRGRPQQGVPGGVPGGVPPARARDRGARGHGAAGERPRAQGARDGIGESVLMVRIIDMECTIPKSGAPSEAGGTGAYGLAAAAVATPAGEKPAGYGMANYQRIFRSRREGDAPATPMDDYVALLDRVGIEWGVPFGPTNAEAPAVGRRAPKKFIALARMSAHDGMRAVRELERLVREDGFKALGV